MTHQLNINSSIYSVYSDNTLFKQILDLNLKYYVYIFQYHLSIFGTDQRCVSYKTNLTHLFDKAHDNCGCKVGQEQIQRIHLWHMN